MGSELPGYSDALEAANLVDLARRRAAISPGATAFTFLVDGEQETATCTYAELDRRARAVAAALRALPGPTGPVLVLIPPGLDFIYAFLGCLYAGMPAVPAPPPAAGARAARLSTIVHDCGATAALTTTRLLPELSPLLAVVAAPPALLAVDAIPDAAADDWRAPCTRGDDVALLQYTSGSTSAPRGCVIRHGNLMHQERLIFRAMRHSARSKLVTWLPPYHDMGLIGGLLQPLYGGLECVWMAPEAFLARPVRWLQAISRHRGTTSGGPNFAFDLCTRKIAPSERAQLDLGSWEVAFNGSEPVRDATLRAFADAFHDCGFRRRAFFPCYGLAEATLMVAGGSPPLCKEVDAVALMRGRVVAASGVARRVLVGCRLLDEDFRVRIVDAAGGVAAPDGIGEIWVAGASVADGYWREARESFDAALAASGEGGFLRTGDLGFVDDGHLFVTGRAKELLVMRGRNHAPEDIESAAQNVSAMLRRGGGVAVAVDDGDGERALLIQETDVEAADLPALAAAVRREVARGEGVELHTIAFVAAGTLPKTTSGKLRRRRAADAFLAGELPVRFQSAITDASAEAAPATSIDLAFDLDPIEGELAALWRAVLGRDPASATEDFFAAGGSSLSAAQLGASIAERFAVALPEYPVFAAPTIGALRQLVERSAAALPPPPSPSLMPARVPLSYSQQRLWFMEQLAPGNPFFHIALRMGLRGALDVDRLAGAVTRLTEIHEALRATFGSDGGVPFQVIEPARAVEPVLVDLVRQPRREQEARVRAMAEAEALRPFDLDAGPLVRLTLVRLGHEEHVLVLVLHHIACDGWSLKVLFEDLRRLYDGQALPATRGFSLHCRQQEAARDAWAAHEAFWRGALAEPRATLELPADFSRHASAKGRGERVCVTLDADEVRRIGERAAGARATPFMLLECALAIVLHRWTGVADLVIGTAVSNRPGVELERVVGCLMNFICLRVDLGGDPSGAEALERTRRCCLAAFEHQSFPFDLVVGAVNPRRTGNQKPIYSVGFWMHNYLLPPPLPAPLAVEVEQVDTRSADLDLRVVASERHDGALDLVFEYDAALFRRETMAALVAAYRQALALLVDEPGQPLSAFPSPRPRVSPSPSPSPSPSSAGEPTAIVLATTFAIELIEPYFSCLMRRLGLPHSLTLIGEDEVWQQLLEPSGALATNQGINIIVVDLNVIAGNGPVEAQLSQVRRRGRQLVAALTAPGEARRQVVCVLPGTTATTALSAALADLQRELLALHAPGLHVIDGEAIAADYHVERVRPAAADGAGTRPFTTEMMAAAASRCARAVFALTARPKKVVVVDCDGTLWRGCCGDAGAPVSFPEPHLLLQRRLVELRRAGFLLCLCSRNNEADVLDVFDRHGELPLALACLSAWRINWLPKSENLVSLADELGLGLDSFVFVDDDAATCAEVRARCPEVEVHQVPPPDAIADWLQHVWSFDRLGLTDDDRRRADDYGRRHQRTAVARTATSLDAFIRDLAVAVEIGPAGDGELERVSQLMQRTTQLNLTGSVLAPAELRGRRQRGAVEVWSVRVADRFGDYGLVGAIVAAATAEALRVEALVLSCRALGRGVEQRMLAHAGDVAARRGLAAVELPYLATSRNAPALALISHAASRPSPPVGTRGTWSLAPAVLAESFARWQADAASQPAITESSPASAPSSPSSPSRESQVLVEIAAERGDVSRLIRATHAGRRERPAQAAAFVTPRTPLEAQLARIWCDLLRVDRAGVNDRFFEAGGHSLLAIALLARIERDVGVALALMAFLDAPTIADLARAIEAARVQAAPAAATLSSSAARALSFAQERLWFEEQRDPGSAAYNVATRVRLNGDLDRQAFAGAFAAIVERHEVLRTTITTVDGQPRAALGARAGEARFLDLAHLPSQERAAAAEAHGDEDARRPFDLAREPLARLTLLRLAPREHVAIITIHHIAFDAWSAGVLIDELTRGYAALTTGQPSPLAPLTTSYADFVTWQRRRHEGAWAEEQLRYWERRLAQLPPLVALPASRPPAAAGSNRGGVRSRRLSPASSAALRERARAEDTTLFVLLLGAFDVLLHRYTGQTDLPIASSVANREWPGSASLIGLFANTVVLRADAAGDPTFRELLARVKRAALEALAHGEVPFHQVVDRLQPERSAGRPPLTQVAFVLQNTPWPALALPGLAVELEAIHNQVSPYDLFILASDEPAILLTAEYRCDCFDAEDIDALLEAFHELLESAAATPELAISRLRLLSPARRHRLLADFSRANVDDDADGDGAGCIHERFAALAAAMPDAVAVEHGEARLSYGDLDAEADRLAARLAARGLGRETIVAVCLDASLERMVAVLGVLKAGAAYLPLDPSLPTERLAFLIDDAGAAAIVSCSACSDVLPATQVPVIELDAAEPEPARHQRTSAARPSDVAYVIYTSGSTGAPKGVVVEHRSVVNLARWQAAYFGVAPGARISQLATFGFDASVGEMVMALLNGATLVILDRRRLSDAQLMDALVRRRIDVLVLVPSLLKRLDAARVTDAHRLTVVAVGEPCPLELAARWARVAHFVNAYGPTEYTVYSHAWRLALDHWDGAALPIGWAIDNTATFILDEHLEPVPPGALGEIYLGGAGLARGYLGRPDLTAAAFLPNPFAGAGTRLYRTGDWGRFRRDGTVELAGRRDGQLKLRGCRIEPGEIEAALRAHPDVEDALVVLDGEDVQAASLIAYVVCAQPERLDVNALHAHARQRLPAYLVPASLVALAALPLSPSGKVDRQRLPPPARPATAGVARTPLERALLEVWKEILGRDDINVDDNIFRLGGDSIQIVQMVARLHGMGIALTVEQCFEHQTIVELAAIAAAAPAADDTDDVAGDVALTPVQRWWLAQEPVEPQRYVQSVLLRTRADIDAAALEDALHALVRHHDALRLRLVRAEGEWRQAVEAAEPPSLLLSTRDFAAPLSAVTAAAMADAAGAVKGSLDLGQGPLLRAQLYLFGDEARLLIVAHHLAVDALSWRILVADLQTAYTQRRAGLPMTLPRKTASFKQWSQALVGLAASPALQAQRSFWEEQAATATRVGDEGVEHEAQARTSTAWLALDGASMAGAAHVRDRLLAACAVALARWTGGDGVWLDIEEHGRRGVDGLNVSRTVGWFTALYPLSLAVHAAMSARAALAIVERRLREVPDGGVGYGVLRYLDAIAAPGPAAEISFNYLGRIDLPLPAPALFALAEEPTGADRGERERRRYRLELTGQLVGDRVRLEVRHGALARSIGDLIALVEAAWAELAESTSAPRAGDAHALTPLQQGMVFAGLLAPDAGLYVSQVSCRVAGALDAVAFGEAWRLVVARHEALRVAIEWDGGGELAQRVRPAIEVPFTIESWSDAGADEQARRREALLEAERAAGFDLARAPLLRFQWRWLAPDSAFFVWTFHHILLDGWSVAIVLAEVAAAYERLRDGHAPSLPPPPSFWQHVERLRQATHASAPFWRRWLDGYAGPVPLRLAPATPATTTPATARRATEHDHELTAATTAALRAFARAHRLTVSTVIEGAWALLLARLSSERDVVFGLTLAGRAATLAAVESTVGLFINTVPMRVHVPRDAEWGEWLGEVQARQAQLEPHAHSALSDIHACSQVPRGQPLFETILIIDNYPLDAAFAALERHCPIDQVRAHERNEAPLTVSVLLQPTVILRLSHDPARVDDDAAGAITRALGRILEGIAGGARRLSDVALVGDEEQRRRVAEWTGATHALAANETIHAAFERQAKASPARVAVRCGHEHISYDELNRRANGVAHALVALGLADEEPVGLWVERGIDLYVGLLAILKAGGAYVPLDPDTPVERAATLLAEARARIVLTHGALGHALPSGLTRLRLDEAPPAPATNLDRPMTSDRLAYVMFTSGSTGRPKGVLGSHRAAMSCFHWRWQAYPFSDGEVGCQKTPLSFGDSIQEIFGPLLKGVPTVVIPDGVRRDPAQLIELLERERVTRIVLVPALLRALVPIAAMQKLTRLGLWIASGEVLPGAVARQLRRALPGARLVNLYGSSETANDVTAYDLVDDAAAGESVPIGRPIFNTTIYLLDDALEPVPAGFAGMVYVAGEGLNRGYLDAAATAAAFLPDPFARVAGARMYRTGDLARALPGGEIEFLSRRDHQVKIRGGRVELGEIESALADCPGVRECVVTAEASGDATVLVAYLVPAGEHAGAPMPSLAEVNAHLARTLPAYMRVAACRVVASLPTTRSGKIDRRSLAAAAWTPAPAHADGAPPQSGLERTIAAAFCRTLGVERVGRGDNFFDLGGHSLLLIKAHQELEARLERRLSLVDLYAYPTVAALAQRLAAGGEGDSVAPSAARGRQRRQRRSERARRRRGDGEAE